MARTKTTKQLVANLLAKQMNIKETEANKIINNVFDSIKVILKEEGKVVIARFGTFTFQKTVLAKKPIVEGKSHFKIKFKSYQKTKIIKDDQKER